MQLEENLCAAIKHMNMKPILVPAEFTIQAFEVKRVIFDDSDLVSLNVKCRVSGQLTETTLLFTFARFNDLLRFSGENGEKLQLQVSDKLLGQDEKPYIIDCSLVFTSCSLELSYLIAGDHTCFSVEEITPISFLQQARNLRTNIRDFNYAHLDKEGPLNHALQEIATMYRYYIGLKELNLNDGAAREKAGLVNDKLFKLAYHAAISVK